MVISPSCFAAVLDQTLQTCLGASLKEEKCDNERKGAGTCAGLSEKEKEPNPPQFDRLPEECDDCVKNNTLTWCTSSERFAC